MRIIWPIIAATATALSVPAAAVEQSISCSYAIEVAQQAERSFSHKMTTTASAQTVWQVWMNVATWKEWDLGLEDAEGSVDSIDAEGVIISSGGIRSPFKVTAYEDGECYAFATRLRVGSLVVTRSIIGKNPTRFQHDVHFTNDAPPQLVDTLLPMFKKALPLTMKLLSARAEKVEQ